jgi:hypothetical protein
MPLPPRLPPASRAGHVARTVRATVLHYHPELPTGQMPMEHDDVVQLLLAWGAQATADVGGPQVRPAGPAAQRVDRTYSGERLVPDDGLGSPRSSAIVISPDGSGSNTASGKSTNKLPFW